MTDKHELHQRSIRAAFIGVCAGYVGTAIAVISVMTCNSVAAVADLFSTTFEFLAVFVSWLTLRRMERRDVYKLGACIVVKAAASPKSALEKPHAFTLQETAADQRADTISRLSW